MYKRTGNSATILATFIYCIAYLCFLFFYSPCFAEEKAPNPAPGKKRIAIFTLLPHPSLDEAQAAFKDEMKKLGYEEGKNVEYLMRNMQGQISIAASIANELAAQNPDVIVTLTTPPTQAVAKTAKSPVVFMAVVDPIGIGIVKSLKGEPRVTGVRFDWAYDAQFQLIKEILPKTRKVGIIYNPSDAASKYNVKNMKEICHKYNFELIDGIVNNTNEVYPVSSNIAKRVDVLFSSDNTAIAAAAAVIKAGVENKVPVFSGERGFVEKGAIGALSVDFTELGQEGAKLTDRVLKGEKNIPINAVKARDLYLNAKAAELMGVKLPQNLLKKAKKVYTTIK